MNLYSLLRLLLPLSQNGPKSLVEQEAIDWRDSATEDWVDENIDQNMIRICLQ